MGTSAQKEPIRIPQEGAIFTGCGELYELIIPENIQNITWRDREDYSFDGSFYGCGKLPLATRKRLQELGYKGKF